MKVTKRIHSKLIHIFYEFFSLFLKEKGRVYMFHSVGDESHELNISITSFEKFLLSIKNEKVIRLEDWESRDGFICVSFDDVADSFYYNAYPLLKKHRIPFTIFVSCSLLDTKRYITTKMLQEIASCELCTIGSHGNKHCFYSELSIEDAIEDLSLSKKQLEELTHRSIGLYAFPFGSIYACGMRRKNLVLSFYKYGFGTLKMPITKPSLLPNYFLPRINADEVLVSRL